MAAEAGSMLQMSREQRAGGEQEAPTTFRDTDQMNFGVYYSS